MIFRKPVRLGSASFLVLAAVFSFSAPLQARTITVTSQGDTFGDNELCTLREAVIALNDQADATDDCDLGLPYDATDDKIVFDLVAMGGNTITLLPGAIELTGGDDGGGDGIPVTSQITIEGPGSDLLTIDGDGNDRSFEIDDNCGPVCPVSMVFRAVIKGLTITNGAGIDLTDENSGLTLDHVVVTGNTTAITEGGGVRMAGGDLRILNSTISNNLVTGFPGGGIGILGGSTTIENSTISGNLTLGAGGGGIGNAGGANLVIRGSTIFNNKTSDGHNGGGILNAGAGSSVSITNSTISGNHAGNDGGGISNVGDGSNTVSLLNVTVFGNNSNDDEGSSGNGGGIHQADAAGEFTITNSVIAGNIDTPENPPPGGPTFPAPDCATETDDDSNVLSGGNNLIGDVLLSCGDNTFEDDPATKNDQVGFVIPINPLLDVLTPADGGNPAVGEPTGVHVPLAGSPLIDAVTGPFAILPPDDQHGAPRPIGNAADIGAVEAGCGNGLVEGGEDCDAASETADCDLNCTAVSCGDGDLNATAGEACDDGNTDDSDGCSATCAEENDDDGDGVLDVADNCPNVSNADQADADGDSIGDACDLDSVPAPAPAAGDDDGDGVTNDVDNCPNVANDDQADDDEDGIGDACDLDSVDTGGCSLIR